MTKTQTHAQHELDILAATTPDALILEFRDEILALCERFGQSGQSGGSAPYTAGAIAEAVKKLCLHETIAPLTGEDAEWFYLGYDDSLAYQNRRNSAVFKHADGRVTYNDSIIKRDPNGMCWNGPLYLTREDALNNTNRVQVSVKGFPFTPKRFYIDTLEEEIAKDDWISWIKDPAQLDEVREYYNVN